MYSKIITSILYGLNGYDVEVEADIARGLSAFNIVGLPDASIKESKERVRSAISNCGYKLPLGRITINLAPASLKKEGSQLDLAIAVSILSAIGVVLYAPKPKTVFIGELALDGRILRVDGCLPMIISLRDRGYENFIVPFDNRDECVLINDIQLFPAESLAEVVSHLNQEKVIAPYINSDISLDQPQRNKDIDFSDIKGQDELKRALEVAAAGSHNVLIIGPPGAGKTMASTRISTILPVMTYEESIECTKIYSISGLLDGSGLVYERPFRSPHHTSSAVSLIGGGRIPKPGEVSLAHHGVLFLDELPEFSKNVLEVLRQPLEDGVVTISRANASLTYPANILLIGSMNPCPCGNYGNPRIECTCSQQQISKYLSKISGPLLDRIDIHVEVHPVDFTDLTNAEQPETSSSIRVRVNRARERQLKRYKKDKIFSNSQLSSKKLKKYVQLDAATQDLIKKAFEKFNFSARSFDKILKLARTIADLDDSDDVLQKHVLEAIRYRSLDHKYWS